MRSSPHVVKLNGHASGILLERASSIAIEAGSSYFIKGWVHPGDFSVVYGQSGSGKTFFALALAYAIAIGQQTFFGRRVRQGRVVLFSLEGSSGLPKRLTAIQDLYGVAEDLFVYRNPLILFQNSNAVRDVIAAVQACEAGLVIFDTLSRTMSGANENSPEDMTAMVGIFGQIQSATGAHVMLVHHSGKNDALGARGHSSLRAAVDVELEVTRSEGGGRMLRVAKGRDDADGQEYGFMLKVVELGTDDDGDPVTTCLVEEAIAPQRERAPAKLSDFQHLVLKNAMNLLSDGHHTELNVRPRAGMPGVTAVRRDLLRRELQKNGCLESQNGETLTRKDIGKVRDALVSLERKGVLCTTDEWVWRP